jgi:hypothetical protein
VLQTGKANVRLALLEWSIKPKELSYCKQICTTGKIIGKNTNFLILKYDIKNERINYKTNEIILK